MLKNILLEFTELYNMRCMYFGVEDKLFVYIKTILSCIQKRELNFVFAFEYVWLDLEFLNPLFTLKYHSKTLKRQLNFLKWFATMSLWQSINLSTMICHQCFLMQYIFSTYWKLLPFLESIWFFPWFLSHRVFDKFIEFKSCVKSASHYFYCFDGFTDS